MVIVPLLQSLGNRGGELKSMTENDPILDVYERFRVVSRLPYLRPWSQEKE